MGDSTLVLLRHGESEWNALNLFTGWVDVDLTEKGRAEAVRGGELLAEPGLLPDVLHTSVLSRAITHRQPRAGRRRPALDPGPAHLAAQRAPLRRPAGQGQGARPCRSTARSSSCSGAARYDIPPPPIEPTTTSSARSATRATPTSTASCRAPSAWPTSSTGCCRTGRARSSPDLRAGKTVLVAAHGNSLRALVKHLDGISDEDIAELNIPTGIPLRLRARRRPQARPSPAAIYLDPEAAAAGRRGGSRAGRANSTAGQRLRGKHWVNGAPNYLCLSL